MERRVSDISADQEVFEEAAPLYQNVLKASGFVSTIEYQGTATRTVGGSKNKRKRKILWCNPPFKKTVSTNVTATFLKL